MMERVFSVDDILGTFWKLHTQSEEISPSNGSTGSLLLLNQGMNRSASEWAFHEFLREHQNTENGQEQKQGDDQGDKSQEIPIKLPELFSIHEDGVEAEEIAEENPASDDGEKTVDEATGLSEVKEAKSQLNPLFSGLANDATRPSVHDPKQYELYLKQRLDLACAAFALSRTKNKELASTASDGPLGIPALPPKPEAIEQKPVGTSGSSREHSEDDEDLSTVENSSDPNVVKRMRRMLSNRESARRSRRRKQAHMSDLEMQVAQLRVENSSLLKKLNEVNKNYSEAAVDNRVLKSDVEALRAKVKMAEDLVKRAASTRSTSKQSQKQHGNKMNRTPSMQRVASLEHLQKRIRGASN